MTHTKLRVLVAAAAAAAMASSVPRSTPSAAQADAAGEIPGQHAQPVPGATTVQGRVLLANSGSGVDRNYVVVDVAGTGVLVDLQRPAASVGVGDSVRVTGVVEPDGEIDDGVIERLPFPPRQPVALRVPLTPSAMGGAAGHLVVATARVRSRERRNGRTSLRTWDSRTPRPAPGAWRSLNSDGHCRQRRNCRIAASWSAWSPSCRSLAESGCLLPGGRLRSRTGERGASDAAVAQRSGEPATRSSERDTA